MPQCVRYLSLNRRRVIKKLTHMCAHMLSLFSLSLSHTYTHTIHTDRGNVTNQCYVAWLVLSVAWGRVFAEPLTRSLHLA